MRTIATTCLHVWDCSDVPAMFVCRNEDCDATAYYERQTDTYWIED